LDQDKFTAAVKAFKERTGNTVKHNFPSIVVGVTQTRKIIRAPKLLCLHLNRLAYDSYGNVFINHSLVPFQEELTLSSDRVLSFDMAIKYRLAAVIEHSGSVMGGHYIAFKRITCPISRTDQDKFLMCNDERTQPIAVADVLRRKAFMIFYEQA
jgi:ubiquitin C-terminal hydrolase